LLGADSTTFYVWNRNLKGHVLQFEKVAGSTSIKDSNTGSIWALNGKCTAGMLKDQQLQAVQSYQEFWHSWSNFHPGTTRYSNLTALEK
jgi:hypothetical protein